MKKEYNILALKVVLFLALLLLLNAIYKHVHWPIDLDKYSPQHEVMEGARDADVIYFGDCSDVYCRSNCASDTSIGRFIQSMMPLSKVVTISANGYHPGIYHKMIKTLAAQSQSSKPIVIITLNLRAFSDHIINDPFYDPFLRQQLLLTEATPALYNRMRLTFQLDQAPPRKELDARTMEAREQCIIGGISVAEWIRTLDEDSVSISYFEDFGFDWNSVQQQRLDQYAEMIEVARDAGWKPVLHLVPYNRDGLTEQNLPQLTNHVDVLENQLMHFVKDSDVPYINHLNQIPKSAFLGVKSNSHYTTAGKKVLAKNLHRAIESMKK